MSDTPNIGFPLLDQAQAQKEVTVNESLVILDVLLGGVVSRTETVPPGSPAAGDGYIVDAPATGVWSGHEDDIAYYFGGVWNFLPPEVGAGHQVWVEDESLFVQYGAGSPSGWEPAGGGDAASVSYTPAVPADWDGGVDPGEANDALDQLAERVKDIEGGGAGNAFGTIVVSGQSDVVADTSSDTLTLVQGTGITITTNAGTDTVTIAASGSGGTELKGLTFTSDTGSTADSDPGNGLFKWNNATQASATVLFFDNQTLDAISLTTFYAALPATGFLYMQQSDDATKWQLWKWTAVTSASGYYKFTVTLQASGGSIADDKTVYCDFKPDSASGGGSGVVVQVKNVQTGAVATGSTAIPHDDTIPQNTEGNEFMTLAITPTSSSNVLQIDVVAFVTIGLASRWIIGALFQDSTANALAAGQSFSDTSTAGHPMAFRHYMVAGTTSSTTFKLRVGSSGADVVTFNGQSAARKFGGVMASSITITEIVP